MKEKWEERLELHREPKEERAKNKRKRGGSFCMVDVSGK